VFLTREDAMTDYESALQASYDRVADEYAARLFGELAHKPLDRALLDCLAEQARGRGPIADIGCGPGQVARYLHERGAPVLGVDLSPGMVALARRLSPEIPFQQGSMLGLDVEDGAWGAIAAFYSIIHLPPGQLPAAMREFQRVLRPGGLLLLAFHVGQECVHLDEWWGLPVAVDFHFYQTETLESHLAAAGFVVEARVERLPYPAVEHPSRRGYLLARKPGQAGAG
jgi:SAM-dependent methyltransferase